MSCARSMLPLNDHPPRRLPRPLLSRRRARLHPRALIMNARSELQKEIEALSHTDFLSALRKTISYDPETGNICRLYPFRRSRKSDGFAGRITMYGRVQVSVFGKEYFAHRLAVILMTGNWPEHVVDHIDGNPRNNAWNNLRCCTSAENSQNRASTISTKSNFLGVSPSRGKWRAVITVDKRQIDLGRFATAKEASDAYREAKSKLHKFSPSIR